MKLDKVLDKIRVDEKLTKLQEDSITDWVIENKPKEYLPLFKEAIRDSIITQTTVKKEKICKLDCSYFIIPLSNSYSRRGFHEEALALFEEMYKKGCNESTLLNDYGAALLNEMLGKNQISREKIAKARDFIFKAFDFDKKVTDNSLEYPAYKNLCFLRNIEARYYYSLGEDFTAFTLGWMSIEMTVSRIWFQFVNKGYGGKISKTKWDSLERWHIDNIIETLFLGKVHDIFLREKENLDILRGIRNKLLHGEINNPAHGEALLCIDVGYRLIPIFNQ